jgi:hypothetical protein
MWYDETIASYGDINYKINKAYCDKYNIELIKCNKKRYTTRHPSWEKIPLVLHYINSYDYVMWIDADAHFYIDSANIVDFIKEHSTNDIIFSKDRNSPINMGCFIVKNTPYSINFFKKLGYDEVLYKNNTMTCWWEQGVLIDMWQVNMLEIKSNSIRLDYGILQHFDENELIKWSKKPFIYHLAGRDTTTRYTDSLKYMTNNGI